MKPIIAAAALSLLLSTAAVAQEAASTGPVTLVQAGRLLDRPGQAPRGPSTVVIRDGRVVEVRDGLVGADAFPGAEIVDLSDRFVLPGLIDSHVHLATSQAGQAGLIAQFTESVPTTAYRAA